MTRLRFLDMIQRSNTLEKALWLGNVEGKRRRGQPAASYSGDGWTVGRYEGPQ